MMTQSRRIAFVLVAFLFGTLMGRISSNSSHRSYVSLLERDIVKAKQNLGAVLELNYDSRIKRLEKELGWSKSDLKKARADTETMSSLLDRTQRYIWANLRFEGAKAAWFEVTAYDAYSKQSINVERWRDQRTALNRPAVSGRTIAVDPSIIPFDSLVFIPGTGWRLAEDVGGAIKGHKIDILHHSTRAAMKYGRKRLLVLWIPKGGKKLDQ
jgi:3D (Asp-Asp-Asp) domain-containing protein